MKWQPIATAPKDRPILAYCNHEADTFTEDDGKTLTAYAASCEGLSNAPTGVHLVEWMEGYSEYDGYGDGFKCPDWWFVSGSDGEVAVNPTHWAEIPEITEDMK